MGFNSHGQLGDGTNNPLKNIPVKITDNVKSIAAGGSHSLLVKTDNTVWATGFNAYGQLGDDSNYNRDSFVKVHIQ